MKEITVIRMAAALVQQPVMSTVAAPQAGPR